MTDLWNFNTFSDKGGKEGDINPSMKGFHKKNLRNYISFSVLWVSWATKVQTVCYGSQQKKKFRQVAKKIE